MLSTVPIPPAVFICVAVLAAGNTHVFPGTLAVTLKDAEFVSVPEIVVPERRLPITMFVAGELDQLCDSAMMMALPVNPILTAVLVELMAVLVK